MASSKQLTGGTKDVNPQILACSLIIPAGSGSKCQVQEVALPVQRLNNRNRSMVMEVLSLQFMPQGDDTHHIHFGLATSKPTSSSGILPILTDSNVFFEDRSYSETLNKAPAGLFYTLHDGAGHGQLVAADKLYLFLYTTSAEAMVLDCRITYRWKNVSLTEYIGIVQATQL